MKIPSLLKKYLMALSGAILVGFVLGHMSGNLLMFKSPEAINAYAHQLQTMPLNLLWVVRTVLIIATLTHAIMGAMLTLENRRAYPEKYASGRTRTEASFASKTMGISGSILLLFIIFHLGHFTLRIVFPEFQSNDFYTLLHGERIYDVYKMVHAGFSHTWVSIFYIISMAFLCMHLSHGVSSMFQSLGFRNNKWRPRLDFIAVLYGWIIFLGFIAIPTAVLLAKFTNINLLPA